MTNKSRALLVWVVVPLSILLAVFALPKFTVPFDASLLLTVTSLIYGVIMAFFIATATSNHLNLNSQLAEANSLLTSIYSFVRLLDTRRGKKIADLIDQYLMSTLQYDLLDHAKYTEQKFYEIIREIDVVDIKNGDSKASALFQNLQTAKADLFKKRQMIVQLAPRVITLTHWMVIFLLNGVIVSLLFSFRTGDAISNVFFGVIIISFYFLLMVLRQVDSNELLERQLAYEDAQVVFKSIGKLRFYPLTALENNIAHIPKETYRVGYLKKGKFIVEQRTV